MRTIEIINELQAILNDIIRVNELLGTKDSELGALIILYYSKKIKEKSDELEDLVTKK